MASNDFHPKLGRIRSRPSSKNQLYINRVIKTMRQSSQGNGGKKRSTFSGSRIGRGYTAGTLLSAHTYQPGRPRVIVKARYTSFKRSGLGAAKAHLRYIQRDGVTPEGEKGLLYGKELDQIDGKAFLERSEKDPHHFCIIVAAEDGAEFEDLKPFIRDLMKQAESDLGTKLDWAAVDHFSTGNPLHTLLSVVRMIKAGDLIIARDCISQGLREQARDLAKKNNLNQVSLSEFRSSRAMIVRSIRMASCRFAIMQKCKEFALVPWKQAMQLRKAKGLGIETNRGISR